MHLSPTPHNPPPSSLATLASRPRSKNQPASALDERDRAIKEALAEGASFAAVADATGLTPRTLERIVSGQTRRHVNGAPVRTPSLSLGAGSTVWAGGVLFDQASAMARAVLGAKPDTCRWPTSDGADFRFCGAPAVTGFRPEARTYCAACAGEAFVSRTRSVLLNREAA